ncbi:hypothetical protein [Rhodococcus ruber]|uniref:hypothetical protein n=1 Tax=Rhodococcus ruber TaxID=1830 RepID=UPI001F302F21|nr:hypothetical protein [Rhodococcus ruber]MCF8783224.1 hypothetical protein [Rhodococcus ruber]
MDVVKDFTSKALAAGIGERRLILTGLDGGLYLFHDSKGPVDGQRKWKEQRQRKSAYQFLTRSGRAALEFSVSSGHHDDVEHTRANWVLFDGKYYEADLNYAWGSRNFFIKACAQTLLHKTRG